MKDSKNLKELITTFGQVLSESKVKEFACQTNAIDKRIRKLPIYSFTILMILGQGLGKKLSLGSLRKAALSWELTQSGSISNERISQQVGERGFEYFQDIFSHLLKLALEMPRRARRKIIKRFKKINILDSTTIKLFCKLIENYEGTKKQAALKLHVRYNLGKGVPEAIKITEGKSHDNPHALYDDENDNILYLIDLGYNDYGKYKDLVEKGNDFVVRLKSGVDPLIIKSLVGDLPNYIKTYSCLLTFVEKSKDNTGELDTLVKLTNGLQIRLVRVWEEKAGKYYTYLTSLTDPSQWNAQEIRELYKYRWAIEILFRDLKMVLGNINIIFHTDERVKVQLYAALCYYVIIRIFMLIAAHQTKRELEQYSVQYCSEEIEICLINWYKMFRLNNDIDITDFIKNALNSIKQYGLKKR